MHRPRRQQTRGAGRPRIGSAFGCASFNSLEEGAERSDADMMPLASGFRGWAVPLWDVAQREELRSTENFSPKVRRVRGAMGFADPDAGIGYGYVTSQMGTTLTGDPRDVALREALYGALGTQVTLRRGPARRAVGGIRSNVDHRCSAAGRPPSRPRRHPSHASSAKGGGESGIRTHGRVSPTHAFQACSFNHSDISPCKWNQQFSGGRRSRQTQTVT